jgi:autotransporter-associated beta strand protein
MNLPGAYSISTVVSNGAINIGANQTFANLSGDGTVGTASGAPTVTVNNTTNTAFSGSLQGALGLTKTGNGTLTLTGTNTFAGHFFENSGTVVIDSGAVNVNSTTWCDVGELGTDNATLTLKGTGSFTNNFDFNVGDVDSAQGTLNISNNATLTVAGMFIASANAGGSTASGTVNQAGGSVSNTSLVIGGRVLGGTNGIGIYNLSGGTVTDSGTAEIGGYGTGTLNISGTSSVSINGTGVSYVGYRTGTGALNINGGAYTNVGELRVGGSDLSGPTNNAYGTIKMTGGTVLVSTTGSAANAGLTIGRGNNLQNGCSGDVYINGGTFTSAGDVVLGYAGTGHGHLGINGGNFNVATTVTKWLIIPEFDTATGELDITNGTLNLNAGSSIKFTTGNTGTAGTPNVINQEGGAVTFYSDFATTIGGGGNLDMAYSGASTVVNTYNLDGGTLTVPQVASTTTGPTRIFNFNGGTLKAAASSTAFFNLGTGNAFAYVRMGGAKVDTAGYNITIAQALLNNNVDQDGGLTKTGNGTLNLNGVNTYTNLTSVNAGTLGGIGTIAGAVTANSGGGLAPTNSGSGSLTISGNITLNSNSTNVFAVNGTTSAKDSVAAGASVTYGGVLRVVPTGTFTVGQAFTLFGGAGATSTSQFSSIQSDSPSVSFTFTNGVLTVASVGGGTPPYLTNSISGNKLILTWPAGQGYTLLAQTNSLSSGLNTNASAWKPVPGGIDGSNNITVNPANPTVFYKLQNPYP